MIKKVLVANRGEIAVRIIRACREMGIETVAVYSEADAEALHTKLADEAVCIGPAPAAESYLKMERIISATIISGADAIHPGYGFLSENSVFARLCEKCNITLIGPGSEVIARMGDIACRLRRRNRHISHALTQFFGQRRGRRFLDHLLMIALNRAVPLSEMDDIAVRVGKNLKFNMTRMLNKMFQIHHTARKRRLRLFLCCQKRLLKFFLTRGDTHSFSAAAERRLDDDRITDFCSFLLSCLCVHDRLRASRYDPEELRERMGNMAVAAAKAAGYVSAGTVEFLLERDEHFYFMEMNTRIQVEHPVTEWVTGIDLVKEQIRIASGKKLSYAQEEVKLTGHAIECRINAENPAKGFRPSPGTITDMYLPGGKGIRVDSAIYTGCEIPPYYDSMIAKLIVWAKNRKEAIRKLQSALGEVIIEGIETNVDYQYELINHPDFLAGNTDITFIEQHQQELLDTCE